MISAVGGIEEQHEKPRMPLEDVEDTVDAVVAQLVQESVFM